MAIQVYDDDTLKRAIFSTPPDDGIILIHPGEYGRISLSGLTGLTLQAYDPDDKPNLERINIGVDSKDIKLIDLVIGPEQFDPETEAVGIRIVGSNDVLLQNIEVKNVQDAISATECSDIEVSECHVHDIKRDGISFLEVNNTDIHDNIFTAFHPNYENYLYENWYFDELGQAFLPLGPDPTVLIAADHADFIQLTDSSNINISGNTLDATGGAWTQSIFIHGEHDDDSPHFNSPVVIEDNIIKNGHPIGIWVKNQHDVEQNNNTLTHIETAGISGVDPEFAPAIDIQIGSRDDTWIIKDGERVLINSYEQGESITPAEATQVIQKLFEGDDNQINYFLLEIEDPLDVDVIVDYETRSGTALEGEDFVATSGTATILAGETSIPIAVEIIGDSAEEEDEDFYLVISNPRGAGFPVGEDEVTAKHTIIDDDVNLASGSTQEAAPLAHWDFWW